MAQGNSGIDLGVDQHLAQAHGHEAQRHAGAARGFAAQAQQQAQRAAGALSDAEIQQGIQGMLNTDPATKSEHLRVEVKDGVATLAGKAPHKEAKQAAGHIAWRYPGVKDVNNQISLQ